MTKTLIYAGVAYPAEISPGGVLRFKKNKAIDFLLDEATAGRKCDLNRIWTEHFNGRFPLTDVEELYRLIGYSASGYGDVFHHRREEAGLPWSFTDDAGNDQ